NPDDYVFTTEGHLLPLNLSAMPRSADVDEPAAPLSRPQVHAVCPALAPTAEWASMAQSDARLLKCDAAKKLNRPAEVWPSPQEMDRTADHERCADGRGGSFALALG